MNQETLIRVIIDLMKRANTKLPDDITIALQKAYDSETSNIAKMQLEAILKNINLSYNLEIPMCQDTGINLFFVKMNDIGLSMSCIEDAIIEAVKRATESIPLRPNTVHPITRFNPGNNIGKNMPAISFKPIREQYIEITFMPKGAGSENMSSLKMLQPSSGINGIKNFILDTIVNAGSKPCPPIVVGIGIGGSSDISMSLAKQATLRDINKRHSEKEIAQLETELMDELSDIGIGPMGLGGKTSILGINIEYSYCHLASLPVGIIIQCWAARRATVRIYPNNNVEYIM